MVLHAMIFGLIFLSDTQFFFLESIYCSHIGNDINVKLLIGKSNELFNFFGSLKGTDYKLVVQGIGQEDRTTWLQVLEGREPVSYKLFVCNTYDAYIYAYVSI